MEKLTVKVRKVKNLPISQPLEGNTLYFKDGGKYAEAYFTDVKGIPKAIGNSAMITEIAAANGSIPPGYNKANWDLAFSWGNHAGKYEPLDPSILRTSNIGVNVQPFNSNTTVQGIITLASLGGTNNHNNLSNIGVNTHSQIDSHIADTNRHYTQAEISITTSQITDLVLFTPSTLFNDYGFVDNSTSWDQAFAWGDHSQAGYLTSFSEIDPVFTNSPAYNITPQDIVNLGNLSGVNTGDQDLSPYMLLSQKGVAFGVAELDENGILLTSQMPSYVDDVLEFNTIGDLPTTGESGKIYITTDTNKTYRWGGTTYVPIGSDLALGETSSTAYRGDRGKIAYDHSQITNGNPHGTTFAQLNSKPTTISGYGITDFNSLGDARWSPIITGAASSVVTADLPASRAVITTSAGKIVASSVTNVELVALSGVTSNIQTQLNAKLASSSYTASDVLSKLLTVDGTGSGLDADTLDGIHGEDYLRSNTSDSFTGSVFTFNDNVQVRFGHTSPVGSVGHLKMQADSVNSQMLFDMGASWVLRDNGASSAVRFTFARNTGNFTANGTVNSNSTSINYFKGSIAIEKDSSSDNTLELLTTGLVRWVVGSDSSSDNDFTIGRGSAWGIGKDLVIDRIDGTMTLKAPVVFNSSSNQGLRTGADSQRLLLGGGSAWASANGAYVILEGLNYGGTGSGGNIRFNLPSGKKVYLNTSFEAIGNIDAGVITGTSLVKTGGTSSQVLLADGSTKNLSVPGSYFNTIAHILGTGVMEIGKYLDFHDTSDDVSDNSYRLTSNAGTLTGSGAFTAIGAITGSSIIKTGGTSSQFLKADGSVDSNSYELSFSKNTAFNKNFGTTSGTVAEGNHTHTFASLTSKPTTISGYGITDFNSLGDARWSPIITGGATSIVSSNLTADRALLSSNGGKVAVSSVTSTELGYVSGVTSALQTQLNSKLNSSSYTAADVLTKIKTVDGTGSGLDADLLRGVHWGNVNTNIITSGSVSASTTVSAAVGIFGGDASPLRLIGSGTGASNVNYISYYESNGTNRQAYVGFDTNSNFVIANELSGKVLNLTGDGILSYNGLIISNGLESSASTTSGSNFGSVVASARWNSGTYNSSSSILGALDFKSNYGGNATGVWASIRGRVAGTYSDSGNTKPTKLSFYTTANTAGATLTENMTLEANGNLTMATGKTVTAANFILSSDIRLKSNIHSITGIWKEFEMNGSKRYGVIAQEVEKTNPELVHTNNEGFKSVSYIDLLCMKMAKMEKEISKLNKKLKKYRKSKNKIK